jgi:hypothetical protein
MEDNVLRDVFRKRQKPSNKHRTETADSILENLLHPDK